MADWSEIPGHLLVAIARKLEFKPDHLLFTAVCSPWRSLGLETRRQLCHQICPVRLVIPGEIKESQTRNCVEPVAGDDGYITYSHNKIPAKQLSVPHQSYVCGSGLGWLVLIDDNFDMKLFNPLSSQEFDLPSSKTLPPAEEGWTEFCKYYVDRAIISVDPTISTPPQTTVLLIYSGSAQRLAFCRLGDKEWTPIESSERGAYDNVLHYKEKFFAVRDPGYIDIVYIDVDHQTVNPYVAEPDSETCSWPRYLVECEGKLFLVVRIIEFDDDDDEVSDDESDNDGGNATDEGGTDNYGNSSKNHSDNYDNEVEGEDGVGDGDESESDGEHQCKHENLIDLRSPEMCDTLRRYKTARFRVYRLEEESDERRNWIKVDNIGENAFFVGYNTPFSLSSTDKFGCKTCKPNSIYFTDDKKPLEFTWDPIRHDIGVYSIDSGKLESVFPSETAVMRPPPFWYYRN
ncbi:hypothetical protein ACHQM5_000141 [Ranunculus cassubicifolius]